MLDVEINLEKIKRISETKEDENYEFCAFLKGMDYDRVDKIVHRLNNEIVSQIDCQECGNCCESLRPCVTDSEIKNLSQLDNISKKDYSDKYVEKDDIDEINYLKDTPCRYLKNKSCSIYESRPSDCKSYPHTHKNNFTSRTFGMIENYAICPIVFNVYELLKKELNFRYK